MSRCAIEERTTLRLPFTAEQFFDVFAAYNTHPWPFGHVMWVASAYAFVMLVRGRLSRTFVLSLLAGQWLWAGVAYHLVFFSAINRAATVLGALFVLEGLLFLWHGIAHRRLPLVCDAVRRRIALGFVMYALLYPTVAMMGGHTYPRIPTFGVPCPTTLLTVGFLVGVDPWLPTVLGFIPILWAGIGGSAALLFGVHAGFMLVVAGMVLAVDIYARLHARKPCRHDAEPFPPTDAHGPTWTHKLRCWRTPRA